MFSCVTFLDSRANSLQVGNVYGDDDEEEEEMPEPMPEDEDDEEDSDGNSKDENEENEEKVSYWTKQLQDMDNFMDGYNEEKTDLSERLVRPPEDVEWRDYRAMKTCASDDEDLTYRPDDCLLITVSTTPQDEISELQLAVYEPTIGNLYVHHHFLLPSFPLALAWMDLDPGSRSLQNAQKGNFVAVGTFNCGIKIYNMDLLHGLEECSLGGHSEPDEEKLSSLRGKYGCATDETKRAELAIAIDKAEKGELLEGSHSDSVTCLGWNEKKRTVLASGSADKTVKLWDILRQSCTQTLKIHTDKVQDLMWHPVEENILLTAGFDKVAKMTDIRRRGSALSFQLDADAECVRWNYHNPGSLLCTSESGKLFCFDARRPETPLLQQEVTYSGPASALDINKHIEGFIATAALDKETRLWKLDLSAPSLKLVTEKNLNTGGVFCLNFSARPSVPYLLCAGGEENYSIWNTDDVDMILRTFPRPERPAASAH